MAITSLFAAFARTHAYATREPIQFIDITEDVRDVVRCAAVTAGQVVVQCLHTTTGIIVNENEENLLLDFSRYLETKIPKEKWAHDHIPGRKDCAPDEPENAKAHIISAFFSQVSITLTVTDGALVLGRYQRIFFGEFDGPCPRPQKTERQVVVSVVGITSPLPQ